MPLRVAIPDMVSPSYFPALAAVELVEYSPKRDRDGSSARVAIELLVALLCGTREEPQVVADALGR